MIGITIFIGNINICIYFLKYFSSFFPPSGCIWYMISTELDIYGKLFDVPLFSSFMND